MIVAAELQQKTQLRLARHYIDKLHNANEAYEQGYDNISYGLHLFDAERPQIERWQAWLAARAEHDDLACELCSELPRAGRRILSLRLSLPEYKIWNEVGLAAARRRNDQHTEVAYLLELGMIHFTLGEYDQALDVAQQGYKLATALDDLAHVALAVRRLAEVHIELSSIELAAQELEQSVALFRQLGDNEGLAAALAARGFIANYDGNWQASETALQEAITLYTAMSDRAGLARCLTRISAIEHKLGHLDEFAHHAEQALAIFESMDDGRSIIVTLAGLATSADGQGNFEQAAGYTARAIASAKRYGHLKSVSMLLLNLGFSYYLQGKYEDARSNLLEALAEMRLRGQKIGIAYALVNLVPVYLHFDQLSESMSALQEALPISQQADSPVAKMSVVVAAVQIWVKTAKFEDAARWSGLVLNHPQAEHDNHVEIEKLRPQLESALGVEETAKLFEQASTLDLDAVIQTIAEALPA